LELIVSLHVGDIPEHAPDHPENTDLRPGVAVRVTTAPALKLVPEGLVVTIPLPVPAVLIVRV